MSHAQLTQQKTGQYTLSGDLTFNSVPAIWLVLRKVFETKHDNITIDLSQIGHTDSAAVALLIDGLRRARKQSISLNFVKIPAQMSAVIDVCNLHDIFSTA